MSARNTACFDCFCGLLCFLFLHGFSGARARAQQQRPVDAAEISRELLYHPARRSEVAAERVIFRAAQFTYRFDPASGQWAVAREKNFPATSGEPAVKTYACARVNTTFRFVGIASDNEGILEIRRASEQDAPATPPLRLALWNRRQLADTWLALMRQDNPELTAGDFARELEIAEPEVSAVADDGKFLWLAIRYYAGEGWLGIGTVVRFDPQSSETKVFQSPALATSSVTHIVAAGGALWLGTYRQSEGTIIATEGLVRMEPSSGEVRTGLGASLKVLGRIVTALDAQENLLWVATDAGMCRIKLPAEGSACWAIVPMASLAVPVPVSNRPGGPPRGRLPVGRYEVRWASVAFLEIVTPDAAEGWMEADDFEDYARQNFQTDAFELDNASTGGASVMRLLEKPEGDPLAGAQIYRAPLERMGAPTPEGWQRVRAWIGWIGRGQLEVVPAIIQPTSPAAR